MTPINTAQETIPEDILAALGERYVGIEFLAAGANGAVFRAHDKNLDKKVAIKILKSSNQRDLILFQKEARAAAKLEHINLVSILNFGITDNNNAYIILEFVDGLSLDRFVESNGHLSVAQSMDILRQVMNGLAHAHSKHISHRDLKTSNIMIYGFGTSSLKAVIIDFGLACDKKRQEESQLATNALFGSPLYMSPEQAGGAKGDERSDIYSLGCIAYRMITGHTPFHSNDLFTLLQMHREEHPPLLTDLAAAIEVPEDLQECLDMMLEKNPADRFQSVEEILDRFDRIEHGLRKKEEEILLREREAQRNAHKAAAPPLVQSFKKKWYVIPVIAVVVLAMIGMVVAHLQALRLPAPEVVPLAESQNTIIENTGKRNSQDFVNVWRVERANILEEHEWMQIIPRTVATIDDSSLKLIQSEKFLKADNLNLSTTPITGTGLKYLRNADIKVLDLSDTKMSLAGYEELSKLTQLEKLSLSRTAVGDRELRLVSKLPHLNDLLLVNCKNVDDKCMDTISTMKSLKCLNVSYTRVTDAGMDAVSKLDNLTNIYLIEDKITDAGALKLLKCKHLVEFNAESCKELTGKTVKAFCETYKKQLTKLSVPFTKVKKEDLVYLKNCPGLAHLNVCGIPITDKELKIIGGFKRLLVLYFSESNFSNEELIRTVAGLPRLETLGAVKCNLTNETLKILRKDPKTGKDRKLGIITGEDQIDGLPDYAKVTFDMILCEDEIGTPKSKAKTQAEGASEASSGEN